MKKFSIFFTLIAILIVGFLIYYKEGLLPVNKNNKNSKIFVVSRGESVNSIISDLHKEGLIRNKIVFLVLIKQLGIENNIQAGDFRLSPSMSGEHIAQNLTKGTLDKWLTIIEGLRKEEIAQIISSEFGIPEGVFIQQAREGYLFPDTYLVPNQATVGAILSIFENNFNRKYSDDLKEKAQQKNLTDKEIIILASLVEKEARSPVHKQKVASIILKRLKNGWPLQIDATVQYALGYQPGVNTWWKKNLTITDLKIQSPYNTYQNAGLPAGPICNPGLDSIQAVVDADPNTPYWFYISSRDGSTMHYAITSEQHQENIQKYLR